MSNIKKEDVIENDGFIHALETGLPRAMRMIAHPFSPESEIYDPQYQNTGKDMRTTYLDNRSEKMKDASSTHPGFFDTLFGSEHKTPEITKQIDAAKEKVYEKKLDMQKKDIAKNEYYTSSPSTSQLSSEAPKKSKLADWLHRGIFGHHVHDDDTCGKGTSLSFEEEILRDREMAENRPPHMYDGRSYQYWRKEPITSHRYEGGRWIQYPPVPEHPLGITREDATRAFGAFYEKPKDWYMGATIVDPRDRFAQERYYERYSGEPGVIHRGLDSVNNASNQAQEAVENAADSTKNYVSDAAHQLGHRIDDTWTDIKDESKHVYHHGLSYVGEKIEKAGDKIEEIGHDIRTKNEPLVEPKSGFNWFGLRS